MKYFIILFAFSICINNSLNAQKSKLISRGTLQDEKNIKIIPNCENNWAELSYSHSWHNGDSVLDAGGIIGLSLQIENHTPDNPAYCNAFTIGYDKTKEFDIVFKNADCNRDSVIYVYKIKDKPVILDFEIRGNFLLTEGDNSISIRRNEDNLVNTDQPDDISSEDLTVIFSSKGYNPPEFHFAGLEKNNVFFDTIIIDRNGPNKINVLIENSGNIAEDVIINIFSLENDFMIDLLNIPKKYNEFLGNKTEILEIGFDIYRVNNRDVPLTQLPIFLQVVPKRGLGQIIGFQLPIFVKNDNE